MSLTFSTIITILSHQRLSQIREIFHLTPDCRYNCGFQSSSSQFIQSWHKWQYLCQTAKKVTSSGAQTDARGYYWFRSPMPSQLKRKLISVNSCQLSFNEQLITQHIDNLSNLF